MERAAAGKQTVAYVQSMDMIRAVYGDCLAEMLSDERQYLPLEVSP